MKNFKAPDVTGWLQVVSEKAEAIRAGLHDGSIPDMASTDADWDISNSLQAMNEELERYERACHPRIEARDLGPSQEQRL